MLREFFFLVAVTWAAGDGILFPQNSETRDVRSLDGLWKFVVGNTSVKLSDNVRQWMPVPASYNDIATEAGIRDHVGIVWYERKFFVPKAWQGQNVWIRFGSVNYDAVVFINDQFVVQHSIGHLPFKASITEYLHFGKENIVNVQCDNSLLPNTIPQGEITTIDTDEGLKLMQSYTFDFFNYAGIHRPVYLYTTPKAHIDDVTVTTEIENSSDGIVHYQIDIQNMKDLQVGVKLYDSEEDFVASTSGLANSIKVPHPKLWWPYLMNPEGTTPGYMYTMQVELQDSQGMLVDIYRLKVGIRSLNLTESTFKMNGKEIYMTGFGRHEDSDLRGRGLDFATVIKDHNLIKWVGGNAYRTSHYPYAEEILSVADEFGIMIIGECPAVNIDNVNNVMLENHKQSITELYQRDKNHPSVIAWSIANEPRSQKNNSEPYWKKVAEHAKGLDGTRPITASLNREYHEDKLAQFLDIISFNRYNSWYRNEGRLDMIINNVITEAKNWREKFKKPILMSEYGADTMEGLHLSPAYIWSEEYQVAVLARHFKAFDQLRVEGWFIGEFVWNFADFKTSEKTTRVGGNKKGIFTRQRQPKAAAHLLRTRYFHLARELYDANLPDDLEQYTIDTPSSHFHNDL